MSVTIENYSERSFVVRGETKEYKDILKRLGGKWNPNLRDGKGWIFPVSNINLVLQELRTVTEVEYQTNSYIKADTPQSLQALQDQAIKDIDTSYTNNCETNNESICEDIDIDTKAINEAYKIAYQQGYDQGYDQGYNKGYDQGYNIGYGQGYDEAYQEGYTEGCEDGYAEGEQYGYREGCNDTRKENDKKSCISSTPASSVTFSEDERDERDEKRYPQEKHPNVLKKSEDVYRKKTVFDFIVNMIMCIFFMVVSYLFMYVHLATIHMNISYFDMIEIVINSIKTETPLELVRGEYINKVD